MFCSQCGRELVNTDRFCRSCGHAARGAPVAEHPPPDTSPSNLPLSRVYEAPRPATVGNGFSTAGIILGAIAFLFFPIVLGPAGLVLGAIGMSKGEDRAIVALVVSTLGLVVGMTFGAIAWSAS